MNMRQAATKYQSYPKYKPSGIAWLGDIPETWKAKRAKYLFRVENGATPKSDKEEFWDGEISWVTPDDLGNLNSLYIQETSRKITEKGFQSCGTTIVPKGSIILSTRAPIGHMGVATADICTNQGCRALVFRKHEIANEYYYYLFGVVKGELQSLGQGSTFLELSKTKLESIFIPVPSEDDASAIVGFLDCKTGIIGDVIAKKQKLITQLKEKRQALITHAVTKGLDPNAKLKPSGIEWLGDIPEGWEVKQLKYLSNARVSNVDKKSEDEIAVRLCNYIDVYKNEFITESLDFMKATATKDQISTFELKTGDVIITKDSETPDDIGVPAFVKLTDTDKLVCGYHLAIITPNTSILLGNYLFRLLQSKYYRSYFEVHSNGVTRFGLDTYSIFNADIILPPISEQLEIGIFIDRETSKIDHIIRQVAKQIEKLQEYRQALITSAVTGKIKP